MNIALATEKFNHKYDSVTDILQELHNRNHKIYWYEFEKISKNYHAKIYEPIFPVRIKNKQIVSKKPFLQDLTKLDCIILKRDPPLDEKALDRIQKMGEKVFTINDPKGIKKYYNKKYLKKFKQFTGPIYFTKNHKSAIKKIIEWKDVVLKRCKSYAGKGVFRITYKNDFYMEDRKINIEKFLKEAMTEEMLLMPFMKEITKGDKRIHVIGGKIIGSMLRKAKKGWISNISAGGTVHKTKVLKSEKKMVDFAVKMMRKDGIEIMGLDTIESKGKRILIEVNTTNIGAFHMYKKLYKKNIYKHMIDLIEMNKFY